MFEKNDSIAWAGFWIGFDLIRANERANQQPVQPLIAPLQVWYGDNTNPLQPPYTITCEVGQNRV